MVVGGSRHRGIINVIVINYIIKTTAYEAQHSFTEGSVQVVLCRSPWSLNSWGDDNN